MWPLLPRAVAGWGVWGVLNCDDAVARLFFPPLNCLFPFSHPFPHQSDQQTLLNIHSVGFVSIRMTAMV